MIGALIAAVFAGTLYALCWAQQSARRALNLPDDLFERVFDKASRDAPADDWGRR
jgi:hypothetical protein